MYDEGPVTTAQKITAAVMIIAFAIAMIVVFAVG